MSAESNSIGLCASCRNVRIIPSDRGPIYYLCRLSATNPVFPKYPRLPVLTCTGYEQDLTPPHKDIPK